MIEFPKKIICVGSVRSNIGKTTVSRLILQEMEKWSAIKLTTCSHREEGVRCPRSRPCGVCTSLKGDFEIITDTGILHQPGKGTAILAGGGAMEVRWVKARKSCIEEALSEALATMEACDGIVIEGNSAILALPRSLSLMVCPPRVDGMKATALTAFPLIDAFIVNLKEEGYSITDRRSIRTIVPERSLVFAFNPTKPGKEDTRQFLDWLKNRLDRTDT